MRSAGVILILFIVLFSSCKKLKDLSRKEIINARWDLHHIYERTYNNGVLISDITYPNHPQPSNFVEFHSNGSVEYRYNSPVTQTGTYEFKGDDSVYAKIGNTLHKWHVELLIRTNFNVKSTAKVGANTIDTYQSFVK